MSKYRIHSGFLRHRPSMFFIHCANCQVATVVVETAQLVLSQFKNFFNAVIEN